MKLMPIDFALLRKADYKAPPKPKLQRASLEDALRQHRKKRARIVKDRRRRAFAEKWMR